jgi:hypothetical protein
VIPTKAFAKIEGDSVTNLLSITEVHVLHRLRRGIDCDAVNSEDARASVGWIHSKLRHGLLQLRNPALHTHSPKTPVNISWKAQVVGSCQLEEMAS